MRTFFAPVTVSLSCYYCNDTKVGATAIKEMDATVLL